jgi:hypothetical protein
MVRLPLCICQLLGNLKLNLFHLGMMKAVEKLCRNGKSVVSNRDENTLRAD